MKRPGGPAQPVSLIVTSWSDVAFAPSRQGATATARAVIADTAEEFDSP